MTAEWFTEPEGFIAETAWGRFQDTPIFRSLAREHNGAVSTHETNAFRKALLTKAIADGGQGVWIDTDSFGPVADLDGNVIG